MNNVIEQDQARLSITWDGQHGDLPDPVLFDSTDGDVRGIASEAVRTGGVPGIRADANVNFTNFVVERFSSTEDRPYNLVMLRPKVEFGWQGM